MEQTTAEVEQTEPVSSVTTEAYTDIEATRQRAPIETFEVDIEYLAAYGGGDKRRHGTPEIYALWYEDLLDNLLDAVAQSGRLPLDDAVGFEEVEHALRTQFDTLATRAAERTEANTTPCVAIRDAVERLQTGEIDTFTLRTVLRGPTLRFEFFEAFVEQPTGLTVRTNADQRVQPAHEAGANETTEEIRETFVDYYNRPRSSYRHELIISVDKRGDGVTVSMNSHNERVVPTRMQRLRRFVQSLLP